jgi:hypothetical protein
MASFLNSWLKITAWRYLTILSATLISKVMIIFWLMLVIDN